MHYIYIFLLVIICIIAFIKERNLYNPTILFSGLWALAMFLSGLRLYDLRETSMYAYTLAFLGVLFFCLGAITRNRFKFKSGRKIKGVNSGVDYVINYKFFFIFFIPVLIFSMSLAAASIALLRRGVSMDTIRFNFNNVEAGLVISNNISFVIETNVVEPAVFASICLIPIVATDEGSIKKYVALIVLGLFELSYIFLSGARSFIIDIVLLFAVYILMNKDLSRKFKQYFNKIPKLVFVILGAGALFVAAFVTTLRKGEERTYLYEIYRYISLALPLFDVRLSNINSAHTFTYGWTLLHGFVRIPFFFFRKLTHIPWPAGLTEAYNQILANNEFYFVGGGGTGKVNSFVTVFYYMFMDFGIPGIIIESFIYGYFAQSCYKRVIQNPNRRTQAMYLLVAIGLLLSFVRLFFTAPRYVYAFVILFFCFVENRIEHEVRR